MDGIVAKKLIRQDPLEIQLLQPTKMQFSSDEQSYGNPEGLRVFSKIEELNRKLQKFEKRHRKLQMQYEYLQAQAAQTQHNSFAVSIRIAALNDLSHVPSSSPAAQYTRNKKAHGGSLKTDIFIIQEVPTEKARLETWKNTIRRYYGIDYEILSAKIDTLPLKFIEVLEERFYVLSLKVWGKSKYRTMGEDILRNCDELINAFLFETAKFENLLQKSHKKIMAMVYAVVSESVSSPVQDISKRAPKRAPKSKRN